MMKIYSSLLSFKSSLLNSIKAACSSFPAKTVAVVLITVLAFNQKANALALTAANTVATQVSSLTAVPLSSTNNQILRIAMNVTGTGTATFTAFRLQLGANSGWYSFPDDVPTNGVKIYYTGTSSTFATTTLFSQGSSVATSTNYTGSQAISGAGVYYFWVTFDINANARQGERMDCYLNRVTWNPGTSANITVSSTNGNPAGYRPIVKDNDLCANAIPLTVGAAAIYGSNSAYTRTGSSCSAYYSTNSDYDGWYSFTAACAGNYVITCSPSYGDLVMQVYSSCGGAALASSAAGSCGSGLSCHDCPGAGSAEYATYTMTAGATYYVRCYGYDGYSTLIAYTIGVTGPNCCTPPAVPTFSSGATTVCGSSSNAQAYAIGSVGGATTYTWAVSGGGSVTGGQGTTAATVTWTTAGNYNVSVTSGNGTCNSTAAVRNVNVYSNNLSIGLTPTNETCKNSATGQLAQTRSGGSGNYGFSWSGSNGYSSTSTASPLTGLNSGTYAVTMTDLTCTGFTAATASGAVISAPWAADAGSDITACTTPVQLSGSYTGTIPNVTTTGSQIFNYSATNYDCNNFVVGGTTSGLPSGATITSVGLAYSTGVSCSWTTMDLSINGGYIGYYCSGSQTYNSLNGSAANGQTFQIVSYDEDWSCDYINMSLAVTVNYSYTTPGTATYAWSAGTSNGAISNPTTSTGGTYTLSVTGAGCTSTDQVVVNINNALNPGTISADQTVACGATPANLVGTSPSGSSAYAYQWQQDPNCTGTWADILGATSDNYQPSALNTNTCFRRKVTGDCGSAYSTPISTTSGLVLNYTFDDQQEPTVNLLDNMTTSWGAWAGHTGSSTYFTAPNGHQGVYLNSTNALGGVEWYNTGGQKNALPSTQYTVSAIIKYTGGNPSANLFYLRQYDAGGAQITEYGNYNPAYMVDLGGGWYRAYATFTTTATTAKFLIQGYEYDTRDIWVYDVQLEQKDHYTPFVSGTRDPAVVTDYSGSGNHGSIAAATTPKWIANGIDGGAYEFSGSNSRINAANVYPNVNGTGGMTFSAWINRAQSINNYNMIGGQWLPYFAFNASGRFQFSASINGVQQSVYTSSTYSDNQWYHYVATYDGTFMRLYINGVADGVISVPGSFTGSGSTNLAIGDGNTSTWYPFNGKIDEVNVYSRALSASEVATMYAAASLRVSVTQVAAPSVSVTQPTCLSSNGTVQVTGSLAGLKFSSDGVTYTNTTGTFTVAAGAAYSITSKSDATGCISAAATGTMGTQPATPASPGAITSNTPQCSGTGITFTKGSCPGGSTCYWVSSATGTETINSAATFTTATTAATYNVWVRAYNGSCWSAAVTASGTVNATPTAPGAITSNTPQCAGTGITFTKGSCAVGTCYWVSSATGTETTNSAATFTTATTAATYNVWVRALNNGCWSTAVTASGTVNATPTTPGAITSNTPQCEGTGITFTKGSCAVGTCYWVSSATGTETTNSAATFTTATTAGTYNVWVRALNNGCWSAAVTTSGTINSTVATPGAITSNTPQCSGTGVTFTKGSCPGGSTCYWVSSATGTETTNSAATFTTATTAATYNVWVRAYNGSCWSAAVTASGTVNAAITTPGAITSNTPQCLGTGVTFTKGSCPTGTCYWVSSATGTETTNSAATFTTATTAGTYNVWVRAYDGSCWSAAVAASGNVGSAITTPGAITSNTPQCSGTGITFTKGSCTTGTCYWVSSATGTETTNSAATFTTATTAATYNVWVRAFDGTCWSAAVTASGTVNATPTTPGAITSNTPQCAGTGITFTKGSCASGTCYWVSSATGTETTNSAATFTTATTAATYNVWVRAFNNGCWSSAVTASGTVNANPTTPGAITSNTPQCEGTGITFTKGSCAVGTCYWVSSATGTETTNSAATFTTATTAGTYNVWVRALNNGCWSAAVTASGTVGSTPSSPGAITSNTPQCEGTGITFTKGSCAVGTCYWVSSATGTETTNSAATFTTATTAGTYNVWVRANSGTCWSAAVSASGTISPIPTTPGAITSNAPQCSGTGIAFTKGSCASGTCYWVSSATGTETTNSASTFTTATTAGTYNVWVRAFNNGCWSTAVTASGTINATPATPGAITSNSPQCEGAGVIFTKGSCASGSCYWVSSATGTETSNSAATFTTATTPATYDVWVRAYNGNCWSASVTASGTVNSTPAAPNVSVTQPTCASANGSVAITSTTSGLTFSTDGTNYAAYSTPYVVAANAGYSITARNGSNCVSTATTGTMGPQPTPPTTPVASVTVQPTCAVTSGTIVVSSPTGAAYEYSLDGGTYQASVTFIGVASGNHTVRTRLAASPTCISLESPSLTVNAFQAPIDPITTVNVCQGGSGNLVAVNNCENNYLVPSNPNSIYGGWASGGTPIADRPVSSAANTATCAFQSGVTRNYHEIPFQVSVTGNYIFVMNDNAAYDGMGYIYTGSFTPGSCGSGTLLRMDNDNGGSAGAEPTLGPISLVAGTTYFIVSTTNGSTGTLVNYDYTWTVTPPSGGDILLNAPGAVQWYDAASGGNLLGTGLMFNPVGVDPALPNTNTNGTHTYYAACSSSPSCRTQADFNITTSETIYNITPSNSSTCYDASVPVSVGLSNSTNGFTYKLFRDGVYTGISNTGNGGAVAIGNTTIAGTYTVQLQTGGCDIPMSGSVVIKPVPVAYAGTDVELPCSGGLTLTGSSNSTTIATLDFGTSVSTQLSSITSGWKLKYLYGTEPANRTEWWISYNGATPYPNYDPPGNSFPLSGSSSALMLIDRRIYQTVVGADYAWDAGTTDEIAYNTSVVDARLYTSVNLAFDYRIGGTFSGSNVYDYLQVVYSLDNGATWTAVNAGNAGGSFTLNRQMSGTTNAFFSRTANTPATGTANVSIPAVAGLQFLLGFRWVNDGSLTGAYVGGPVIDNINVTGAASYSWSPTSGVSGATTATPTVTQAGTYTVVVTAGNNCTASDQVIVATPNVPTISLTSAVNTDNQTACPGSPITDITYAVGGSATGAGVSGLPAGVTGSYNAGVFTITGTPSILGTYNYTVTTTGSACPAATANGTINVTSSASYGAVASGDQVICGGSGTPDPVTVTGATGTYQWYVFNGVASSCPTGTSVPSGWNSLGSTNGANTATYNPASISASRTYACLVTASCGSPTWASGCRTVTVDPVFTRDVVEEPCMSMSEATSITVGNINYSYFNVTATGGTSPYTFPADNAPTLKRVGTITTGVAYAYEMDATTSDIFVVTDALGCQAGSSVVNPTYTSQPTEIAVSNGVGTEAQSCHDYGYNRWITYLNDNAGINEAILSINSYGNNLGLVTVNMYRENDEPIVVNSTWAGFTCPGTWMRPMERHFMVTTSNAPSTWGNSGNKVGVRLYFTHQELTDLIAETYGVAGSSNFGNGCNANDDVTNINDLYVTKYTAPPGSLVTENGDYSDNIANQNNPSAIYRLFGDNVTAAGNGPLRKDKFSNNTAVNFDGIYGRSTPSVSGVPQPHHFVELDVEEFSEFWLHGTSHITPLPVEIIYLEANAVNNAFIRLKWATALEVNNDGFQIERSTDGQTWATIGWVNGNDNATTQTNYTFDDVNVVANTVYYYRLKQVDNDGAFEYTDIVSARITGEVSFSVKDFIPNPTMDKTNLIITASKDQDITVTFYNVVGQKVLESTHQVSKGGTRLEFELGKMASGTYTAIVSSANDVYTKKVVLAR